MGWTSKTGQFDSTEMGYLEDMTAAQLARELTAADPVVALRGLAEVMLNGDNAKLTALLADKGLRARWQSYKSDRGVDARDHEYARELGKRLP